MADRSQQLKERLPVQFAPPKHARPPTGGNRPPVVPVRKTGQKKVAVPLVPMLPQVYEKQVENVRDFGKSSINQRPAITQSLPQQVENESIVKDYEMMPAAMQCMTASMMTPADTRAESPEENYEELDVTYMNVPSKDEEKVKEKPTLSAQTSTLLSPGSRVAAQPYGIAMRPAPYSLSGAAAQKVETAKPPTQPTLLSAQTVRGTYKSVFEVTQKDVDKFKTTETPYYDEDEAPDLRSPRAKDYKTFVLVVFWTSVFLCLFPSACTCLCIALFTSIKTADRNNAKDYKSAHCCKKWTLACTILAIIFLVSPVIIITAIVIVILVL